MKTSGHFVFSCLNKPSFLSAMIVGCALLCQPALMAANLMPPDVKYSVPPTRPWSSLWMEAEDAESNIPSVADAGCYAGNKLKLDSESAPGPEGYYVRFKLNINADRAGGYRLFAAIPDTGRPHLSPFVLLIDGKKLREFGYMPWGSGRWGAPPALLWADLGDLQLPPGAHTVEFVVREKRGTDKRYFQLFDAISLVYEKDAIFPAKVMADKPVKLRAKSGTSLSVPVALKVAGTTLKEPRQKVAALQMLRLGELVAETPVTLTVGPDSVGKSINVIVDLPVPFDAPTDRYELALTGFAGAAGTEQTLLLGTVDVESKYPAIKRRAARLSPPIVTGGPSAKAGGKWTFSIKTSAVANLPKAPSKAVVRLELAPHVCYFAQSLDLAKWSSKWMKGKPGALGPFNIDLPSDLPGGSYRVQVAIVGESYSGEAGQLQVTGSATRSSTSIKPLTYGTFVDGYGVPHVWYSAASHALIWDGEPFLPVSGMFNGPYMSYERNPDAFRKLTESVQTLKSHGLNHIYLTTQGSMEQMPAWAWQYLISYLEEQGMSYVIGYAHGVKEYGNAPLDSRVVRANPGYSISVRDAVLPGKVKRVIITGNLNCSLKKVTSCLALAVNAAGNSFGPVDAELGHADADRLEVTAEFSGIVEGKYTVFFLPQINEFSPVGNPWATWRQQVNGVGSFLSKVRFGPGMRGFIDMILPGERGPYNHMESLFFVDPQFTTDRAAWLQRKYGKTSALANSWALLDAPPTDFVTAARLFPAISEVGPDKNTLLLLDPVKRRVYRADAKETLFWYEYLDQRDESYGEYTHKICSGIRDCIDVPITMKRDGMTEIWQSNPIRADRGLDGAGYEIYSTGDGLVGYGAGAGYVEMLQAKKSMLGSATEFARGFSRDMPPNWPDIPAFFYDLSVAQFFCAKSTYLYLLTIIPEDAQWWSKNRLVYDSRMLEWMAIWKHLLDLRKDAVVNHVPMIYTSWPRPDPWWISPSERRCVRNIDDVPGLGIVKAPNGIWVIPVFDPSTPAPVTVVTMADDPGVRYYKDHFENLLKRNDRMVVFLGLRKNLGALSIDRYFTSETFDLDGDICQVLKPTAECRILEKDSQGRVWALQVGKLQIVARKPKKQDSLESMVKYAHLPSVPETPETSVQSFLNDLMKVSTLSLDGGKFVGVAYEDAGQPTVVLHSTTRSGGETLDLIVPDGKTARATIPAEAGKIVEAKGGGHLLLKFSAGPGDDPKKGAGSGPVTIVGLNPEDLKFSGISTTVAVSGDSGVSRSAVPDGFTLPPLVVPPKQSYQFIDNVKASAALDQAADEYNRRNYKEAEKIASEWISVASLDLLPAYNLLLGHTRMLTGDPAGALKFYSNGLSIEHDDTALRCALGVAFLAQGDKTNARKEFEAAAAGDGPGAGYAKRNLAAIERN